MNEAVDTDENVQEDALNRGVGCMLQQCVYTRLFLVQCWFKVFKISVRSYAKH